jgi:rRNA maturation endonuclease Nob1
MTDMSTVMRCTRCRGLLEPSGKEPYRHICSVCGTNFMLVMQVVEVPSVDLSQPYLLPEKTSAD